MSLIIAFAATLTTPRRNMITMSLKPTANTEIEGLVINKTSTVVRMAGKVSVKISREKSETYLETRRKP